MTSARRLLAPFHDLRLRVSAVIMGLQVLGQVGLGFKVSIAQIAASIVTAVAIELGLIFWRERRLAWPASALLTGNGTALLLRTAGTRHGDWWSLNGILLFVFAAALGILSKHVIKLGGRHVYNPSNFGLVACFVIAGPFAVYPQYLWWGDTSVPLVLALLLIIVGALWVLRPLRMELLVVGFAVLFLPGIALLALSGRCIVAIWSAFPVCGYDYWTTIALSPELLVFVFFMMSDPRTTPEGGRARLLHGGLTAAIAVLLIAFQPTEYGVKLGLLTALTLSCAAAATWRQRRAIASRALDFSNPAVPPLSPAVATVLLATVATSVSFLALAGNQQIRLVEQGRPPPNVPSQRG